MEEEIRLAMEGDADAFLALMDRGCCRCDPGNDYQML